MDSVEAAIAQRYRDSRDDLRPAARLTPRGADQVEGRVLRIDRDGLLVDWGGRLGTVRNSWAEVGARIVRVARPAVTR